jgi:hypothetical protein
LVVPGRSGIILKQEEGVQVENDRVIEVEVRVVPCRGLAMSEEAKERQAHTKLLNVACPSLGILLQLFVKLWAFALEELLDCLLGVCMLPARLQGLQSSEIALAGLFEVGDGQLRELVLSRKSDAPLGLILVNRHGELAAVQLLAGRLGYLWIFGNRTGD